MCIGEMDTVFLFVITVIKELLFIPARIETKSRLIYLCYDAAHGCPEGDRHLGYS
jgi:hypothetical protein